MLNALKTDLSSWLHISKDALHVHLGLAILLVAILVLRRRGGSWTPWLVLLGFELVNEALDLQHGFHGSWVWALAASAKDIVNTMFWPTLVILALRSGVLVWPSPKWTPTDAPQPSDAMQGEYRP
jgi:hypothetical protein